MSDETATLILALATENAELRMQLAEAQDVLVETSVDAGELHRGGSVYLNSDLGLDKWIFCRFQAAAGCGRLSK